MFSFPLPLSTKEDHRAVADEVDSVGLHFYAIGKLGVIGPTTEFESADKRLFHCYSPNQLETYAALSAVRSKTVTPNFTIHSNGKHLERLCE